MGLCAVSLVACKDKEPPVDRTNHGKVYLTPESVTLKYGETAQITPSFSDTGDAKNKTYRWVNGNKGVVDLTVETGNKARVKALRAGQAAVRIYSTDGKIYAESKVNVETQTNLLNHVLFEPGRTPAYVKTNVPLGTLSEKESTDDKLVYDLGESSKILQEIYYFKNGGLSSTLVILKDEKEIIAEAEMFIKERFEDLNLSTTDGIKYYDMGVFDSNDKGQVVGIFLSDSDVALIPEGVKGKSGVKFTTQASLGKTN